MAVIDIGITISTIIIPQRTAVSRKTLTIFYHPPKSALHTIRGMIDFLERGTGGGVGVKPQGRYINPWNVRDPSEYVGGKSV